MSCLDKQLADLMKYHANGRWWCVTACDMGRGKLRSASLRGGKMRGTVQGINARRWVICEAGMCEVHRTTGAAGIVVGCEPLKHN